MIAGQNFAILADQNTGPETPLAVISRLGLAKKTIEELIDRIAGTAARARCAVVEILTTTGMVLLAMVAKDGGRFSSAAKLAAAAPESQLPCAAMPAGNTPAPAKASR